MTYDAIEVSITGGKPVALYEFSRGNIFSQIPFYRYTSADRDVTITDPTYGVVTYTATPISDDGIKQSGESADGDFTVTLPADTPIATWFQGTPPSSPVYVKVRRMHYGDTEAPIFWIGTVQSAARPDRASVALTCYPMSATFQQDGQRLSYGTSCPHTLYGPGCTLAAASFATDMTITALTGVTVTSPGFALLPDGRYAGGYIEFLFNGDVPETRPIQSHVGDTVTLLGATDGLSIGLAITSLPGCAHNIPDCNDFFDNLVNYGGFPFMPGLSPFDGTPVF